MKHAGLGRTRASRVFLLILRYGGAVLIAAATFGLRLALTIAMGPGLPPFVLFLPAVMIIALLAGLGPGILATAVASFISAFWIFAPVGQLGIASANDALGLILFAIMGVFMSIVAALFRRARRKAAEYQKELLVQESEKRFSAVFRASSVGMNIRGFPDMLCIDVNQAFLSMTGFSREEVIGKTSLQLQTWVSQEDQDAALTELREQGSVREREIQQRKKSGETWIARFSAEMIETGGENFTVALFQDVTEQNRTVMSLRESEQRYRSLFQNMLNGFAFCKMLLEADRPPDFIYLEVNAAFETLTGLKDVVGKKVSEVIPGVQESDPVLLETYGRVSLTGVPERFETYLEALHMWFSISVYCPKREYFVAVFDVITERKRTEAERQLLASAVEQAAEMILITDPAGSIQYVNPAFESVTGYSKEEVLGRNPRILKGGEHEPAFYEDLWKTISGGKAWEGHFVNKRKDGTHYTEDATISPVHDATGRIANYVGVKRDSTREHLLEEQLRQAQKMESVGRLAGGVAHDFNNMLQVITSYVEFSLAQVDAANVLHKNLQQIQKAARRSAELTGQLLAFARKQTVAPKVIELNEAVAGMLKMLQRLIGEDIDLVWKPAHTGGKIKIDPSQLDQVLANLAVNSRDAIAGVGKLTIGTDLVTVDETHRATHAGYVQGKYMQLEVSDDGSGMDKETLSHMFEPFFTTKGVGEGTGLGLATVYGIVQQNSGFINVYSEPGKGTTFKICLPLYEGDAGTAQVQADVQELPRGTETIMVVEDEAGVLELSKMILENLGYTTLTARTPAEAVRVVNDQEGGIHLLVTDVVMPQMNGRDLAGLIAEMKTGIKVLFMSGYTADAIAHQGILEEGVNFISKPFSMNALAEKVREVLG